MDMKQTYLILLLTAFCGLLPTAGNGGLRAQKLEDAYTFDRKADPPLAYAFSEQEGSVFTLELVEPKGKKESVALVKYDAYFKRVFEKPLYLENKHTRAEHLAVIGGQVLIFTSIKFSNPREKKLYFYQYGLDGRMMKDKTELYGTGTVPIFSFKGAEENNYGLYSSLGGQLMTYKESPDHNQLLCYDNVSRSKMPEKFRVFIFSGADASIVETEIKLPYIDRELRIRDAAIAPSGVVYMLGRHNRERLPKDPEDRLHILFEYKPGSGELNEIPLPFEEHYVSDLGMTINDEARVLLGGFYSQRNTVKLAGALYARYDPATGKLEEAQARPFSEKLLSRYVKEKKLKKEKKRVIRSFYLRSLVARPDDGLVVAAEQFYVTSYTYTDAHGNTHRTTVYHYNDVLTFSFNAAGAIQWHNVVEKTQSSSAPAQLSYGFFEGTNKMMFVYRYKEKGKSDNLYYQTVSYDGKSSERKPLFADFHKREVFQRRSFLRINDREGIMLRYSRKKKTYTLVKIAF